MSVDDILRAYPEATRIQEDLRMKPELRELSAKVEIKGFRIGDENFDVHFFVKSSIGLHEVDIVAPHSKTKLDLTAAKLQELLTEKYGTPKMREPDNIGGFRLMWTTSTLKVVLEQLFGFGEYWLSIAYTPPSKDALDKL